jgi:hypothetical protein
MDNMKLILILEDMQASLAALGADVNTLNLEIESLLYELDEDEGDIDDEDDDEEFELPLFHDPE